MPSLNMTLPEKSIKLERPTWVNTLQLADPNFENSMNIDAILGADVYEHIVEPEIKKGEVLLAQKTKLGWVLLGKIPIIANNLIKASANITTAEFQQKMQRFFDMNEKETEQPDQKEIPEIIYQSTTVREPNGRYLVALPFKDDNKIPPLGNSRNKALIIYKQIEKRLNRDPKLKKAYNEVLQEYLDLGHMKEVPPYVGDDRNVFYLPHHAVVKAESKTTKVRVVFNASAKTTSGSSLNDHLYTGYTLQDTLAQIILKWRMFLYAYIADIEKQFRMVGLLPEYYNFQRFFWKPDEFGPIREYIIMVLIFGNTSSSFLTIRSMLQLAIDEAHRFPLAAKRLKENCYVDNVMTGAETKEEAMKLQEEMVALLKAGGFNLRQWATNDKELLENIPVELREDGICEISNDQTVNTLGIQWYSADDILKFKLLKFSESENITKRQLLSNIASIYDPSQWLAPFTIRAKILMQRVWQTGIGWDEVPSDDILTEWRQIKDELSVLPSICIPRWTGYSIEDTVELHGFCDASEVAYAAVVYLKTRHTNGKRTTNLLWAKTRVTPLNSNTTQPKRELNGAEELAKFMELTITTLSLEGVPVYCWCDSQIVLAWLQKELVKLEKYVANRVSKIRLLSKSTWKWSYIRSKENPADCASRGIKAQELKTHKLWWKGSTWLSQNQPPVELLSFSGITMDDDFLTRYSNFAKLVRITAYCTRFTMKFKGAILADEYEQSRLRILRIIQQKEFSDEIDDITKGKPLKKRLRSLNPFIDRDGILRVGGRLRNANVNNDYRHPILLPPSHHVTHLLIREAHERTMHGTVNMVRQYLRMRYWLINDKKSIRHELHRCLTCLKQNSKPATQLMGDYPAVRINPAHPFMHCGVDFAGPFRTRMSKGRSTATLKGYICLFICMATKAIHLELVSDLSTEAFLAAFKRFISRRGLCKEIYSDHGTNFTGASKYINQEMAEAIERSSNEIARITAKDGVSWKFIPVATPHFGGLWEVGVKSAKRHIKGVFDECRIVPTFEEFSTILCQIEACLNSRPLVPLSNSPDDLEALTPAHFLVSRPLMALPEVDITNESLHDRWQQLKQINQIFWKRWV
ncbi:uncharacterized protein LOC119652051 [Hermetia illucens]|uniref:uncharacterized protein LOC119652051 n=1 Tax=Hermetia illucens TaxID=343691 RepID=UPI0018CBFCB4|nr:uncharacterized protein LOC119652051 [Hermetia illucens]